MKEACVTVHIVHTSDVDNHMLDAIHTLGVEIHSSDVIPYARRPHRICPNAARSWRDICTVLGQIDFTAFILLVDILFPVLLIVVAPLIFFQAAIDSC